MSSNKYVAYYRVSTDRQGKSGLGLEAQQTAVVDFIAGTGSTLTTEFTEIESGKDNSRPRLQEAIQACKLYGARLLIAKMDRLSRNLHFITGLMESGVDFVAVDNPHANRLTVHILAAVAEDERNRISERTKAALAAAKARGVKLGPPSSNLSAEAQRNGSAAGVSARQSKAKQRAGQLRPIIQEIRAEGAKSFRSIAAELNARGIPTPSGKGTWQGTMVGRIYDRS